MKHEEIMTRLGEIEQRSAEINTELEQDGVDLDALKEEARKAVENGAGTTKEEIREEKKMDLLELRGTPEYMNAFAKYLKGEIRNEKDDAEVRSLLTTNATAATGYVPVPTLVDDIVRHAWENEEILQLVRKTNFKGNVKVAFELSADGAYVHSEGAAACTEEALTLGIVEIKAENIKKWITISDEAVAMGGEAFLRYIYDELTYQIIKKLKELVVADILALQTSGNNPLCTQVTLAPAVGTIAQALATLSDEAVNPVIIMNRLTWGTFKAAQAANNYGYDPFEGLPVLFASNIDDFATASSSECYAIVGDLDGAQVNYPEGEDVVIKWDDISLAEKDLVKVVGRQYAAHAVTASKRFCQVLKPSAQTT